MFSVRVNLRYILTISAVNVMNSMSSCELFVRFHGGDKTVSGFTFLGYLHSVVNLDVAVVSQAIIGTERVSVVESYFIGNISQLCDPKYSISQ